MSLRYHHGSLKTALVEQTLHMATTGGSPAVNLRAAARQTGVSHAAVYRHFKNRLDLLAAAATEAMDRLGVALERAAQEEDCSRSRIRALARGYLAWAASDPGAFRLAFCQELWDKEPYPALRAASDRASRPVLDAVAHLTADANRARRVAVSVWAHTHGMTDLYVEQQLKQGELRVPEGSLEAAMDLLEDGVDHLLGMAAP